jgi:hypothetical protein
MPEFPVLSSSMMMGLEEVPYESKVSYASTECSLSLACHYTYVECSLSLACHFDTSILTPNTLQTTSNLASNNINLAKISCCWALFSSTTWVIRHLVSQYSLVVRKTLVALVVKKLESENQPW